MGDQKTVKESKTKQPTKEHVEKKRKHMLKKQVVGVGAGTQDDATSAVSHNVVATKDDEQGVQLPQPLLSGRPVHDHGADGAGDGGQPPDWWLLRRPPASSTSARARCPAPACLPPTALGLPALLLLHLLFHLLLHLLLSLSPRLRRRLCRRVGLGERD